MSEQSLSYLAFHIDSDFEIHLFVLDLETTYVIHLQRCVPSPFMVLEPLFSGRW